MSFPEFYARVPRLVLRDPLAALLGAAEDGIIEYRYEDAVRLAGHSCPTVAGAYLMAARLLHHLYGEEVPERGGLRVEFQAGQGEGVTGVVAAVFGLITGAAGEGGFKGLGGRHGRRHLLRFGVADVAGIVRLVRVDSGAAATASLDLSPVPAAPEMAELLGETLAGEGGQATAREFAALWQDRVRRLLLDHFDDPAVVRVTP